MTDEGKKHQEEIVGRAFASSYQELNNTFLTQMIVIDPPDLLFSATDGTTLGVELFEVEQMYAERRHRDSLSRVIYGEFKKEGLLDGRYSGICISLLKPVITKRGLSLHGEAGIGRFREKVSKQLISLFLKSFSQLEKQIFPEQPKIIKINSNKYPDLFLAASAVVVSRCPQKDVRSPSGLANPLILTSSSIRIDADTIIESLEGTIKNKINKIANGSWTVNVDKPILVAHDLPRDKNFEGFWGQHWNEWLAQACLNTKIIAFFTEVWLVEIGKKNGQNPNKFYATKIC